MAGLIWTANSGEVTLSAATAKTVLQVKAPSNQRVTLKTLSILGKQSAGGTDAVCKVRITRSTANFGTGTAATPGKTDTAWAETIQSTVAGNFTVEPTSPTDTGLWYEVQPQSGLIVPFPPGQEPRIPGGAALNVEITSSGTPTLLVTVTAEE